MMASTRVGSRDGSVKPARKPPQVRVLPRQFITCQVYGKSIENISNGRKLYCSTRCKSAAQYKRYRLRQGTPPPSKLIYCATCQKIVKNSRDGQRKYCSQKCKNRAHYLKTHPHAERRQCDNCGRWFLPWRIGIRYCSLKCLHRCSSAIKRHRLKHKAVVYKGGKCQRCGYSGCAAAFDFHHRDATEKEWNISHLTTYKWEQVQHELDKCDLLCANCHRELHFTLSNAPKINGESSEIFQASRESRPLR